LVNLHTLDYKKVGLGNISRHNDFYQRQIKTFASISRSQAAAVDLDTKRPVGEVPHFEEMISFLNATQPPDRSTLVHGDFKMDNILLHKTEPRVIGILDWEMATIGHPLSDFVGLTMHLPRSHTESSQLHDPHLEVTLGLPQLEQCIQWYMRSGYNIQQDLPWGTAFAGFRGCVIMQGIAARYAQRQASGSNAKEYADNMRPSAERVWTYMQELLNGRTFKHSL
jgi:aminoglycoside phosphotransferase (APT) family kinase protein